VLKGKEKRGMTASSLPLVQLLHCSCEVEDERSVSLSYEPISAGEYTQVLVCTKLDVQKNNRFDLFNAFIRLI
jgi:hypothetical protein